MTQLDRVALDTHSLTWKYVVHMHISMYVNANKCTTLVNTIVIIMKAYMITRKSKRVFTLDSSKFCTLNPSDSKWKHWAPTYRFVYVKAQRGSMVTQSWGPIRHLKSTRVFDLDSHNFYIPNVNLKLEMTIFAIAITNVHKEFWA